VQFFTSNFYFIPRRGMSVCLSVCLCASITQKLHGWTLPNFLCILPLAMAQSTSDDIAMRYVLPVLHKTSCFHTVGPVGRIKHDIKCRWVCQMVVPVGHQTITVLLKCLVVFVRIRHRGWSLLYVAALLCNVMLISFTHSGSCCSANMTEIIWGLTSYYWALHMLLEC